MIGLTKLPALRQPATTILSRSSVRAARTNPMRPAPAASHRLLRRRKFGSPPKVNELSTLTQGISRKSDVLAAFGEPRGYGAGLFSPDIATQEIWFYEYMETDGVKTDLKFLLFFFDKDLYNGHLWFSSSSLMDTGE